MLDFINFAKQWIKKNLPKGKAPYMTRVELFEQAIKILDESNKDRATKIRIK